MKNHIFVVFVLLAFSSCEKLKNENIIPEDAPRLTDLQQQYQDILVSSAEGWYIEYASSEDRGPVSILMQFAADGRVTMLSDMHGFNEEHISTYRVGGVTRPELIFDTYSVWSLLAESAGGNFEFLMYPQENGQIVLKNIFVDTHLEYTLRKATSGDRDAIVAKSNTSRLLHEFNQNSSAYFKNIILESLSAFWEIDISTQQLKLTWIDESNETVSQTFSYTNLAQGIRLAESWMVGNIVVDDIQFGGADANTLEVTSAGNAGAGQIEVSHIPAFPYTGTADLFIYSNSLIPGATVVRFLGYTADRDAISDALKPYYDTVVNAIPTFWRIQIYNLDPVATPRNRISLVGRNAGDTGNIWYNFYYDLTKEDESHVALSYRNEVGVPAGYTSVEDSPDVQAFLQRIYPPAGVTIIPAGRSGNTQKLRVISREDSRYYIEILVSTPTGVYVD